MNYAGAAVGYQTNGGYQSNGSHHNVNGKSAGNEGVGYSSVG